MRQTVAATQHTRARVTEAVPRCMTWIGFLYVSLMDSVMESLWWK
jgi:hypothetical protein